jgi:mycofactocin system glycosyltransferase
MKTREQPPGWRCRLAAGTELRRLDGRHFLVCDRPLTVLEVREPARRLLARLPPGEEVKLPPRPPLELRFLLRLADLGLLQMRPAAGAWPSVSIVVPVRDRPAQLAACLASLDRLRYPGGRPEVIVVDDGSVRAATVPAGVRLVRLPRSLGSAGARNAGAAVSRAALLAFVDSDCTAEPGWLKALVPELADPSVAAAGGRILPMATGGWLERYEAVRSPLDLGEAAASVRPRQPVPFLVTANLVVRRSDFEALGGFDPGLRRGEDVDLCWRLAAAGRRLVYQPAGHVRHAHRGSLRGFLATRAGYAASEAALLRRHPDNRRWLGFSAGMGALVAGGLGAMLGRSRLLGAGCLALGLETAATAAGLRRLGVPAERSVPALLRGQASTLHHAARQLTRYYGLGAAVVALSSGRSRRRLLAVLLAAELVPAMVDWRRRRPSLSLPAFLAAHALDDAAYQFGLIQGCVRERTLAPLGVELGWR